MMQNSVYEEMTEAEKQVADFLQELSLWWVFESPVFLFDDKGRPRVWTPDFYVPALGVYIEVCGTEEVSYEYRKKIYRKNDYNVIFVQSYKQESWRRFLVTKIKEIDESRHSKVQKIFQ